jgi:hypothetical protein
MTRGEKPVSRLRRRHRPTITVGLFQLPKPGGVLAQTDRRGYAKLRPEITFDAEGRKNRNPNGAAVSRLIQRVLVSQCDVSLPTMLSHLGELHALLWKFPEL